MFSTACAVSMTSCMSLTPNLDSQFGNALSQLKEQQTLDPMASASNTEAPTMDARSAREAINTYNASYRAPERPQNVFMIGGGK